MELTQGRTMSEAVMLALARKGMDRQKAHELIRGLAMKSDVEKRPFKEILAENSTVRKMLSEREIDEALDPRNYLGTAVKQVELVVKKTKQERKVRGLTD
jgi:adenylosuccinate lyase